MTDATRRRRAALPKKVLVFGESENDTRVIEELIVALCPGLANRVKSFRNPPILIKDASVRSVPDRVQIIVALIRAESLSANVLCVFAHEDCDDVEPAHEALSLKIEEAFARRGHHVHAVTPAWETEAWLLLWPDALAAYRPKWHSTDSFKGRDIGQIVDAKETMIRALRPSGSNKGRVRDYRESDAPGIAKLVRSLELARIPAARSRSYARFREHVEDCCSVSGGG